MIKRGPASGFSCSILGVLILSSAGVIPNNLFTSAFSLTGLISSAFSFI